MSTHKANAFYTTDYALATVLVTVGIPFADPSQPFILVYKHEEVKKRGLSVKQMMASGEAGQVQWGFARTEEIDAIIKDFNEIFQSKPAKLEFQASKRELAQAISLALRNRKDVITAWKQAPPHIAIDRGGVVTYITETTPKDVLEQLGVSL